MKYEVIVEVKGPDAEANLTGEMLEELGFTFSKTEIMSSKYRANKYYKFTDDFRVDAWIYPDGWFAVNVFRKEPYTDIEMEACSLGEFLTIMKVAGVKLEALS